MPDKRSKLWNYEYGAGGVADSGGLSKLLRKKVIKNRAIPAGEGKLLKTNKVLQVTVILQCLQAA